MDLDTSVFAVRALRERPSEDDELDFDDEDYEPATTRGIMTETAMIPSKLSVCVVIGGVPRPRLGASAV